MPRSWLLVVVLGTLDTIGCGFRLQAGTGNSSDGGPLSDGSFVVDTPGGADAPPDASCDFAIHFDSCMIAKPPSGGVVLTPGMWTFDTDARQFSSTAGPFAATDITQPAGGPAVLLATEAFDVQNGATLRVVGAKPLIIGSWTTIVVDGEIDAGSQQNSAPGAGANPVSCSSNAAAQGAASSSVGGGGGGGGFRGAGGSHPRHKRSDDHTTSSGWPRNTAVKATWIVGGSVASRSTTSRCANSGSLQVAVSLVMPALCTETSVAMLSVTAPGLAPENVPAPNSCVPAVQLPAEPRSLCRRRTRDRSSARSSRSRSR